MVKGSRTLTEIASEVQVHPNLLMQWKKQLFGSLPAVFADKRVKDDKEQEAITDQLYQQIGHLKVELDVFPFMSFASRGRPVDARLKKAGQLG